MSKQTIIYKKEPKSFIPNSIIERMMFTNIPPSRVQIYMNHVRSGSVALATAQASKDVYKWHIHLEELLREKGVNLEYEAWKLFEKENV